jgi:hypothetical protein
MKTWFISGTIAGVLIARSSRTDLRAIRRGEEFLGVPWRQLEVGMTLEERTPGKGRSE